MNVHCETELSRLMSVSEMDNEDFKRDDCETTVTYIMKFNY